MFQQYQWRALVFGVVLLCLLSNAQSTSISDEIAQRKLNCTAILIEKPKERETNPPQQMASTSTVDPAKATSIYDFTVKDTFGEDVSLEKYRGQVVLIVNIASQCGLTKANYAQLTELKEKYSERGLRILGFPCNQFAGQMPEGDGEEMVCHLREKNADFGDIFAKVKVNGDDTTPLYTYLKNKKPGTLGLGLIKWNFTKFLVDKNGVPVERYAPTTSPSDIAKDIENLL